MSAYCQRPGLIPVLCFLGKRQTDACGAEQNEAMVTFIPALIQMHELMWQEADWGQVKGRGEPEMEVASAGVDQAIESSKSD